MHILDTIFHLCPLDSFRFKLLQVIMIFTIQPMLAIIAISSGFGMVYLGGTKISTII